MFVSWLNHFYIKTSGPSTNYLLTGNNTGSTATAYDPKHSMNPRTPRPTQISPAVHTTGLCAAYCCEWTAQNFVEKYKVLELF